MNKSILALAVSGLFLSSAAMAGDGNWTGLKIGIGGGGKYTTAKSTLSAGHSVYNDSDSGISGINDASGDYYSDDGENIAYVQNYYAEEGFDGSADGTSDLGKGQGFATFDATYDWQVNDTFVFGIIANYDVGGKSKVQGHAAGGSEAGWYEDFDVSYPYGYQYGGGNGSCTYEGGCIVPQPFNTRDGSSNTGIVSSFETGNSGAIGARLGIISNKTSLLYVTGGWATIKVKQHSTYTSHVSLNSDGGSWQYGDSSDSYDFTTSTSTSSNKSGYFVGAGLQSKLTDNISAKLEYRYYDYGTIKSKNAGDATVSADNNDLQFETDLYGSSSISQKTKLEQHAIRAVVSYDF